MSDSRWICSLVTHTGLVRTTNEDRGLDRTSDTLWAVADGMGGHVNGAKAAETVVRQLDGAKFTDDTIETAVDALSGTLKQANSTIHEEVNSTGQMSGTTAVVLAIRGNQFVCLWAGDSRCYILRDGRLYRLSLDHTVVRDMLDRGLLAREDTADHPMRHVLSRVVGGEVDLQIDAVIDEWRQEDVFLLCSDGLTGLVDDADIERALLGYSPEQVTSHLLSLTLERGAPDNVTIIVVCPEEKTALRMENVS